MVRLKDRYLLVTIVYADVPAGQAVSDLLLFNQPTTGELRPQMLLKGIRSQVAALFGDCGSGAIDRSLQGVCFVILNEMGVLIYFLFMRCSLYGD